MSMATPEDELCVVATGRRGCDFFRWSGDSDALRHYFNLSVGNFFLVSTGCVES